LKEVDSRRKSNFCRGFHEEVLNWFISVDRTAWKSNLGALKVVAADDKGLDLVTDEMVAAWHSKVVARTKRIEEKSDIGLQPKNFGIFDRQPKAPKRKLPPSQEIVEVDSPPPPQVNSRSAENFKITHILS
jgi:hypothetical protein